MGLILFSAPALRKEVGGNLNINVEKGFKKKTLHYFNSAAGAGGFNSFISFRFLHLGNQIVVIYILNLKQ